MNIGAKDAKVFTKAKEFTSLMKKVKKKFGGMEKSPYLCIRKSEISPLD
jgi:hypothetical protein